MVRFFDPLLEEKKNLYQLHLSMEWNFALTVHKRHLCGITGE
jgi:hypothetical protein